MKIFYHKILGSTQEYLKELVKNKKTDFPIAIVCDIQTNGVGSRDNNWHGYDGNLFLSFAIELNKLPIDLKLESSSIYFAYLLKETLFELGSHTWVKWPNDFYIDNLKIGGMITNIVDDKLICGVGLNLVNAPQEFAVLDIVILREELLKKYFIKIENTPSWKQVFSKYKLEFHKNKKYFAHDCNVRISLENATLCGDGSIISNGKRIYSLR
ncbi:MAG: biotin--[acetyl-CoA-carboxylase] ligase [Campylobacterota bacterium]|nr:biotin--[acetyl-CoA-carboxylase] ligase [Campylobacterota bacterium]